MKIKSKLLLSIFIPGAILVLLFMGSLAVFTKANISIEIANVLKEDAEVSANTIDSYFYEKKSQLVGATYIKYIKDCMDSGGCSESNMSNYLSNTILFTLIDSVEISLLSSNGVIIASTNEDLIGNDKSQEEIFKLGKDSFSISDIYKSDNQDNLFLFDIAAPIIKNNKTVGVITSSIVTDKLYDILAFGFEDYKTADRYIVNNEGLMGSPSRFLDDAVLNQRINSDGLKKCKNNPDGLNKEEILIYNDYSGAEVFGSYSYIPQTKWCLLTEIDYEEASTIYRDIISLLGFFSILAILILLLIAWRISKRVSKPIIKLAHDVKLMDSSDNFYTNLDTKTKDEIGHLSRSINKVIAKLRNIIDNNNKS